MNIPGGVALGQYPVADSVSPAQNESNVPSTTDIVVRFSDSLVESTIDSSTFLVYGEFSGPHCGSISYYLSSNTAILDPYQDFAPGERVTIVLTSGIESLNSQPLDDFTWSFTVLAAAAPAVFSPAISYIRHGGNCWSQVVADVDNDQDLDIAMPAYTVLYIMRNNGTGVLSHCNYSKPTWCTLIAAGDLNGDSATDLITWGPDQSEIATFINNGDGSFAPYISDTLPSSPRTLTIADFDLDGHSDVLATYPSIDSVIVHFGAGDGSFPESQSFAVDDPYAIVAADLDNDGGVDIAVTSIETGSIIVIQTGDVALPQFSRRLEYDVGEKPVAIIASDLNGDYLLDLAVADSVSNGIYVVLNDPGNPGTFTEPSFYAALDPVSLDAADIDGDGDMDILVANASGPVAHVLWNDGSGVFGNTTDVVISDRQREVVGADLDGDSDIDLAFVRAGEYSLSLMFNRKWMFVSPTEFYAIAIEGSPDVPEQRYFSIAGNYQDMQFDVADDAEWLTEVPSSGTAPADITVYVNTEYLVAGDYTESIQVSTDAENSPETVTVNLCVYPSGSVPVDYIRICVDSLAAGTVNAEIPFVFQRLCPNPDRIMGISNGFTLQAMGEATWTYRGYWFDYPTLISWFNLGGPLFTNGFDGESPDTFLIGGASMPPAGMPIFPEQVFFALYLDIGPGEGEILIDSAFTFSAGYWRWPGLNCGFGGAPHSPLFLAKDSSDEVHPISIRIYAVCGDADRSAQTDIDDVVFLIAYIFMGGPAPNPEHAGDVDCSGSTDIDDVLYLISYIFGGGVCVPCD